ncbi:hypothetical protein AAT19DRAFT_9073 [Rhodotorula toruloides]|uniref:Uncharacterized protein n=1 Tax=Rhodotorula toruloides TaxID=5286 RepID=A0A2T0AJ10_RHOTO|nr:hypothetical protein AAT19DRAFT_9073 [Rhodotorula toruloides]
MLLSPARAALFALLAPFAATSPVPLSPRAANGSLVLWDPNPSPLYHSTSSYICRKKVWYAAGAEYPLAVDAIRYPFPAHSGDQDVLTHVGNYTKPTTHAIALEWETADLGDQCFALRLADARGQLTYSPPLYSLPGNEFDDREGDAYCISRIRDQISDFFVALAFFFAVVSIVCIVCGIYDMCHEDLQQRCKKRKEGKIALQAMSTESDPPADHDNSPRSVGSGYQRCEGEEKPGDAASIASSFTLT